MADSVATGVGPKEAQPSSRGCKLGADERVRFWAAGERPVELGTAEATKPQPIAAAEVLDVGDHRLDQRLPASETVLREAA